MIDVGYYYSGGSNNATPQLSLGGPPSNVRISNGPNTVFGDIEEVTNASTDFRCVYAFNDSPSEVLKSLKLFLLDNPTGSEIVISLGTRQVTDEQKIYMNGIPSGGSLTISYGTDDLIISGDSDPLVFSENIRIALDNLASGVKVESQDAAGRVTTVRFEGDSDFRSHPTLVVENNLVGVTTASVEHIANGGPINHAPALLINANTTPNGIEFTNATASTPIEIGELNPGDGFAFWIRRGIPSEVSDSKVRQFSIRCQVVQKIEI